MELRDDSGNRADSDLPVTLRLLGGSEDGLAGLTHKAAIAGVAGFDGLRIDQAGGGYRIVASAPGLQEATSPGFDVRAGEAVAIAWIQPPADTTSDSPIAPVEVELRDALGNPVEDASALVTLSLAPTAPASATLSGTLGTSPSQGRALFADLSIDRAASHYQLLVETEGIAPSASAYFSIVPGEPAQLAFLSAPKGGRAGAALDEVAVGILDVAGNLTESMRTVSLGLEGGEPGASLLGTSARDATAGVSTFGDLEIDEGGVGYVLVASSPGLAPAQSDPFDLSGCPTGYRLCDGACVDLDSNSAHCGSCNNDCDGFACVHGFCESSCARGMELCDDTCVDLQYDREHCGECGESCGDGAICFRGDCQAEPDRNEVNWPLPPEHPTQYVITPEMVEDRITGLTWQRRVLADSTFHWNAAGDYCRNLRIGGRSDWRLPTVTELLTIVDSSRGEPSIHPGAFPNTPSTRFATASQLHGDPDYKWHVDFEVGRIYTIHPNTRSYPVRCVRGGGGIPGARWDVKAATVTDKRTGLTWLREVDGTSRPHADAEVFCSELTTDGREWRLPTKKELESLVERHNASPAFNTAHFPELGSDWRLWTQTQQATDIRFFWVVETSDGSSNTRAASANNRHHSLCVSDAPPDDPSGGQACAPGEALCGGACVDLQDDPLHCGGCNIACSQSLGEVCSTGLCTAEVEYDWANWKLPPDAPSDYDWEEDTVTDRVTGLVWQRWLMGSHSWQDAMTYCSHLRLEGHTDWRVPALAEILSLGHYAGGTPAFPQGYLWSATISIADESKAWVFASDTGPGDKTSSWQVRCVRGGSSFNGKRYAIGAETALDLRTGLEWQRDTSKEPFTYPFNVAEGEAYCSTLGIEGHEDWRLPTKRELESIVDRRRSPSIYEHAFPDPRRYYWTSTQRTATSFYWLDFGNGSTNSHTPPTGYVRCVREP